MRLPESALQLMCPGCLCVWRGCCACVLLLIRDCVTVLQGVSTVSLLIDWLMVTMT